MLRLSFHNVGAIKVLVVFPQLTSSTKNFSIALNLGMKLDLSSVVMLLFI